MRTVPIVALAAAVLAACGSEPLETSSDAPPNLVLIVVDTLRADGGRGLAGDFETPWIDRLGEEGVRFPLAFTHAPMTLPAHVALFSSRLPHQTGVVNNAQPVPEHLPLLADHLRRHGYQTHAVTSLGTCAPVKNSAGGLSRGFDTFAKAGWGFITPGHEVNSRLMEVLDGLDERAPFFLFAHFSDPHEPYNAHDDPEETAELLVDDRSVATLRTSVMTVLERELWLSPGRHRVELSGAELLRLRRLELTLDGERLPTEFVTGKLKVPARRVVFEFDVPGLESGAVDVKLWLTDHTQKSEVPQRYASEVRHVDRQVGFFLRELHRRGLYTDSLVVLTSDHGESIGERRFIGHVKALFDELIHVPLVFRLPNHQPGLRPLRARSEHVVGHVDVVPTILELLDLPPLEGQMGHSLLDPWNGVPVLSETHPPEAPRHLVSVRDDRRKLIYDVEADEFELYDLRADPREERDVFARQGPRHATWQELLRLCSREGRGLARGRGELTAEEVELLAALGYIE